MLMPVGGRGEVFWVTFLSEPRARGRRKMKEQFQGEQVGWQ